MSRRNTSRRATRGGRNRYIGPNSGANDLGDGTATRAAAAPSRRTTPRRSAGEAPNPPRRKLGNIEPAPRGEREPHAAEDRSHIRYRLRVPPAARQLLEQADRLEPFSGGAHIGGMAAAAAAAELCRIVVVRSSAARAGTLDTSEVDLVVDEAMHRAVSKS